ncbi:DUF3883 domain-containing protein [Chryseobacterium sp.]|uniref:DUF3883 domain-containing protein n=1 Tax=Chryseobacterium sp. TaxID=1871047 RepID=UPI000ECA985E|nr:DUF3883 domain-containing protein [Chryseobacterium sp.]HCA06512.1 hypothetical protein [Chryseobacterium sp.]
MEPITLEDLKLINTLSKRKYPSLSMPPETSENERVKFNSVKRKLKEIADYFVVKYDLVYGPFQSNVSPEANPVTRGGKLHNVWSTLFKGASNKQYAAQISFVIEKEEPFLNIGFYFGRASRMKLSDKKREESESTLNKLGLDLSNVLTNNAEFRSRFDNLFELGFDAYSKQRVLPDQWIDAIKVDASNSQITVKVRPNDFGIIENSIIDFYVSQVIFLMSAINNPAFNNISELSINPLTPEQSAKRAERNAQIGLAGEIFVLENEKKRLIDLGITRAGYPKHVALQSSHHGYDILSLNSDGEEIFIEVKTTTRIKDDPYSKLFFITNNEYNISHKSKHAYIIRRVYDIENDPHFEDLDLELTTKTPNGYIISYS